jgi:hypothetical protein
MARKKTNARPAASKTPARTVKKSAARNVTKPPKKSARASAPVRASAPARASTPVPNPTKRGIELLNWTHSMTTALLADWPIDSLTYQSIPTDNHALWTIGHLATTYSWLASLLDGHMTPMPDNYGLLFGMGSKPVADPAIYPPMGEVRHHFDSAYERLVRLAEKIEPADALKPTVGNSHGFARDRADVLDKAAWHEGWHSGQLSSLRRVLGLKNLM